MRPLLAAACLLLASPALAADPITLPFEILAGEVAVHAKVDGVDRRLALALESPYSYLKGGTGEPVRVEAGALTLVPVRFAMPTEAQRKVADGAIGMDLLRGMAVGVDEFHRTVTLWPRGATPTAEAAATWAGALVPWGGPVRMRRTPIAALATYGTPATEATLGGRRGPAVLTLVYFATAVEPALAPPNAVVPGGRTLAWGAPAPDLPASWILAQSTPAGSLAWAGPDVHAVVAVNALGARRTLVDLAANAIVAEDLATDVRLSRFVSSFVRWPFEIHGDEILTAAYPGTLPASDGPTPGLVVVRLAGAPAKEWLDALRGRDGATASPLARLLFRLFDPFDITVLTANGREMTFKGSAG